MFYILYSEWLKLKRSKIVVIGFFGTLIVPLLVAFNCVQRYLNHRDQTIDLFGFYDSAIMFLMLLFAPLVLSVIATYLISREYNEKTLKTIFTVPISRKKFLYGKFLTLFIIVILFMILSWAAIFLCAVVCNLFMEVGQITVLSAVFFLSKMLFAGVLLYLTITPVIYLSIRNKGFVTPFIAVAAICLLNVILSNSPIAGFFPWTASYILVSGRSGGLQWSPSISFLIIVLLNLISVVASRNRFLREDIG